MNEPDRNHQIALTSRMRSRAVGEDGVLVHLDSGRVIVVNEVGLYIISLLQQPMTREALLAAIVNEFDVGAAQAEADLLCYLDELAGEKLLKDP